MKLRLLFALLFSTPYLLEAQEAVVAATTSSHLWAGGSADQNLTLGGAPSVRWNPGQSASLAVQPAVADFSSGSTVQVAVHAQRASDEWLKVTVESGGAAERPGRNIASGFVQINLQGWQEVLLPRSAFAGNSSRVAPDWRSVRKIEFSFPERPAGAPVLNFGSIRVGEPRGPRLTDEDLLKLIDLDRPELAEVRRLSSSGNLDASIRALASYFRYRAAGKWWFDPSPRDPSAVRIDMARVKEMVASNTTIIYRHFPFRGGVEDWYINPTAGHTNETNEWLWPLNRMDYWNDLGAAWWKTGDSKYAQLFVHQLRSWAQAMPMPNMMNEAPGSGWRGLEAGIRGGETWPQAWHRFLSAPEFTDGDLILMLKCFADHGRYLSEHRVPDARLPSTNHYLIAWSGLYTVGAVFPEFKAAGQWRAEGRTRLVAALQSGLLSDGGWYEFAPGYHLWVLSKATDVYKLARLNGDERSFGDAFARMLQRGYEWPLKLMAPDRTYPKVNDTGSNERMRYGAELAQLFPGSALLRWAASLNDPARVPDPVNPPVWRSTLLESSGYAVLRSGWGPDANYLCFDAGRLGGWHGHQDKLSLMVWAKGREMLFDGGGGTYDVSAFRKYGQQTESHNTVMVDRLNQNRTYINSTDPIGHDNPSTPPPVLLTNDDWDYAAGWYLDGYGPERQPLARHRREVVLLQGELVLIADTLIPKDDAVHEYEARWHLKTTNWTHQDSTGATATTDEAKPNLLVVPLQREGLQVREDSGVRSPRLLGWDVERDRSPEPALTVRHTKSGAGTQRFVTLLLPLSAGEKNPISDVRSDGARLWRVLFTSGRQLQVEIGRGDTRGIRVVDTTASGDRREYDIPAQ